MGFNIGSIIGGIAGSFTSKINGIRSEISSMPTDITKMIPNGIGGDAINVESIMGSIPSTDDMLNEANKNIEIPSMEDYAAQMPDVSTEVPEIKIPQINIPKF